MNAETKRFLGKLALVAVGGWIAGNWMLGGPGLSKGYLEAHRLEHEHYLEITKGEDYKRYMERSALVDLSENPQLQKNLAFVESYASDEEFSAERHRLELRALFFDIFNASLVVILAIKLGRQPLLRFLDEQAEALREKLNKASRARSAAASRLAAAEEKSVRLHEVEMKVNAETENRVERELAELAAANHFSFGLHERDLADRKAAARQAAELAVRRALVEEALRDVRQRIQNGPQIELQDQFITKFIQGLEAKQ